jgi:hypothetical protein
MAANSHSIALSAQMGAKTTFDVQLPSALSHANGSLERRGDRAPLLRLAWSNRK